MMHQPNGNERESAATTSQRANRRAGTRAYVLATLVAAVFAAGVAGFAPPRAAACDTSYWTVGCQYYSPSEGHTVTAVCCGSLQTTYSTCDTFTTDRHIWTTAGGSWYSANTLTCSPASSAQWDHWQVMTTTDKLGCYNHHTGTMFINCREYSGWDTT